MTRALILTFLLSVASSAAAQSDLEQGGTIWFYYPEEEPSPLGNPMLLHVNILTRQLATIGPGEYFGYPVPVGIHAFSYTRAPSRDEYLALSVRPGQEVYVEVHFRDLKSVPPEEGRLAVRELKPISVLNVIDLSVIVPGTSSLIRPPATAAVVNVRELPAPKPPPPSMLVLPPVGKSPSGTILLSPQSKPPSTTPALSPEKELPKEPQKELAPPVPAPVPTPLEIGSVPLLQSPPPQRVELSMAPIQPPQKATLPQSAAVNKPRENQPPPLLNAIESFPRAKLNFLVDGAKREVDAVVTLDKNALIVTDRKDRAVLKMFSYSSIRGAEYAFARSPKWSTPVLGNIFFLDPKAKKHWFMVRTNDDYALVELDSGNFSLLLEAYEVKTGRKVETVEETLR